MGLFQTIRQADLARKIADAKKVVIYAAPGATETIAKTLFVTAMFDEA